MQPGIILRLMAVSTGLTLVAGCSDKANLAPAVAEMPAQSNSMPAQPTINDLQLVAAGGDPASTSTQFATGEPIQLSMTVEGVDPGATVAAYWYGPDNSALAYELKPVAGNGKVDFTLDNTLDWQDGAYRAEIWVAGKKIDERRFDMAAG